MAPGQRVYEFDAAIARKPGRSVVDGLRAVDKGPPSAEAVMGEHEAYVAALRGAGVRVQVLEPLEAFSDSVFVEDPALVYKEAAILLRPGTESRMGEVAEIAPTLRENFTMVFEITEGFVDGGDVLNTPDAVMIGLSTRTDRTGARNLIELLAKIDYPAVIFNTPAGILHFKTDCSLIDDRTILTTGRLAASGAFDGFDQLITPDGEEAGANALRVNDTVFVGSDFPGIISMLRAKGYRVEPLPTTEIGKVDAGLSCMSLRWRQ